MATIPRRSPPSAAGRRTAAAPARSSGFRGAEGMRMMETVAQQNDAAREASMQNASMPFRFFCPVGETREYIIVDDKPDFFRFEHNLENPRSGRWDIFCACLKADANCPVDRVAKREAYFAMYLTIIDLTPYTDKDGNEVEWSKKLLVIKVAQQKKFARLYERQGSLRGMLMAATRDGEKDAGIGNDQEHVETIPEEELVQYERQYTDKKGVVHDVIGHEPFDYEELFPMPTEQQLRALVGGQPEPGSREESGQGYSRRAPAGRTRAAPADDWEEPAPADDWEEPAAAAAPARRLAPARRPAPVEEEEAAPVARRPAPARRAPAPVEDIPEEELYQEDTAEEAPPPPRRAAPGQRAGAPVRRPAPAAVEEDDPPQRGRAAATAPASLADRRRALRRG